MTTWDSGTKSPHVALSNGDMTATMSTSYYGGVLGTVGKSTGKVYFEFNTISVHNFSGVGGVGISDATYPTATPPNQTGHFSAMLWKDAEIATNGTGTGTSMVNPSGHVVGVAVDIDNNKIWFQIDGTGDWNAGGTANPATGVGGITISSGHTITPMAFLVYSIADGDGSNDTATLNTGGSAFTGTVPSGFSSWDTSGETGTADMTMPTFTQALAGVSGNMGDIAMTMALFSMEVDGAVLRADIGMVMSLFSMDMEGVIEQSVIDMTMPLFSMDATGVVEKADIGMVMQKFSQALAGMSGPYGVIDMTMPLFSQTAYGEQLHSSGNPAFYSWWFLGP